MKDKIIKGGQGKSDEQLYEESELFAVVSILGIIFIVGIVVIKIVLEVVK